MVLVVVALQVGNLQFDLEDGGFEGQKDFPRLAPAVTS
jgi:hypothetical protein